MQTTVQYYTAFSTDPACGNPAGLVLDGDRYTDVQKQEIARRVGLEGKILSLSGTVEDPVTGTASGVMGAYYLQYVQPQQQIELVVEQGFEMGRDGRVLVRAARRADEIEVSIAGSAAYMKTGELEI